MKYQRFAGGYGSAAGDRSVHGCQEFAYITKNKLHEVNRKMADAKAMHKVQTCSLDNRDEGLKKETHCSILEVLDDGGTAISGGIY